MKKALFLALSMVALHAMGQEIYTMKFLPQLPESQWSDASNANDDYKMSIGVPVLSDISFYFYNSGFTYNQLFSKVNDSTTAIHPGSFINHLKTNNYLSAGANVTLLSFSIKLPQDYTVGFSVSDRAYVDFSYPKSFMTLLWYGNSPYIGKTVDIGNFGLNASWYREYALHGTKKYGKWTFGASPKLLFGKTNINTKESSLKLYTDTGYYNLTATANMNIQTSGMHDSDNQSAFNTSNYILDNKNLGLAIDLGARYDINEHISVAAGINDLGYIHWKSAVYNYTANSDFTWNGFDANTYFHGDSLNSISSQKLVDSLSNLVKLGNNVNSYTTSLPYNIYGMGFYKLNQHVFGLQLSAERFNKNYLYAAVASYQVSLGSHFVLDFTYTAKTNSLFNIGGAAIFRGGCIQVYLLTDNWWAPIMPLDSKYFNLQSGINILLGHKSKKDDK